MDIDKQISGIALRCNLPGTILQVIRDELDITDSDTIGQPLTTIVDQGSFEKTLNFLTELRTQGATFGWELNVPTAGQVTTLHFAGGVTNGELLIIGARTRNGIMQLYEELMRTNNEQVNALRMLIKEQTEAARAQAERDSTLYDEISRLNNELVTMQRELAKKNVELERLNQHKDQFLGMAAHDLRTPLAVILSYSEFLLDEAVDRLNEEHLEFLSIIHSSSEFMLQLVNELLDVATIESGKLQLNYQPTDLVDLLERNVALNRVLAKKKQIRLSIHYAEQLPEMMVDAAKIEQVLNNLIANAIKYSYLDSTVEIRAARHGNRAVISVKDEGQGIPAAELENLFELFGKTSIRTTGGEKITGLGLAIAPKIVHEHQGEIWLESQQGIGTTFYVSLPYGLS
ncbi:HAMP domain-containing histidine kinase [bacterium]|nr:HAMP domain-containing histidine kinase [bacterium]